MATTLRKILDRHMQSDIDAFMPWNFAKWLTHIPKGDGRSPMDDLSRGLEEAKQVLLNRECNGVSGGDSSGFSLTGPA